MTATSQRLEEQWQELEGRQSLLPGKECLARMNTLIQNATGSSVSAGQIAATFEMTEIPVGMAAVINMLQDFGRRPPAD